MKTTICIIVCFSALLSSCSGSKFLKRKYTNGVLFENRNSGLFSKNEVKNDNNRLPRIISKKAQSNYMSSATQFFVDTLRNKKIKVVNEKLSYSNITKHNTIYVDTTKFTSLINQIYLQTTNKSCNPNYINTINNKKDSIYIKQRKGRDSIYGKSSQLQPVIIILNSNNKIIKTIKGKEANRYSLSRIKNNSIVALCLSLMPVLGFIISIINRNRLKKYEKLFKTNKTKEIKKINTIALIISIFSLAFLIGIIAYLFYLISLLSISFSLII